MQPETRPTAGQSLLALAMQHPAMVLTGLYLVTATIGLLVALVRYLDFGILIFDWWEPSDFFLAAFREPWSFALAAGAVAYTLYIVREGRRHAERLEQRRARMAAGTLRWWERGPIGRVLFRDLVYGSEFMARHGVAFASVMGLFLFVGLATTASTVLNDVFGMGPPPVVVTCTDGRSIGGGADRAYLLGTSNRFLFLGDGPVRGQATILPFENVVSIRRAQP